MNISTSSGPVDYTVAIPAFGRPELTRETIRAALAQRFPSDMSWEILVNDDCSPVPLRESLAEFGEQIRITTNARNLGWPGNWNETLHLARGRWVHMLHSDDIVHPDFSAVVWQIIKQHPNAAYVHTLTHRITVGRPLAAKMFSAIRGKTSNDDASNGPIEVFRAGEEAARHALHGVSVTTVVVRRALACSTEGMRPEFDGPSDEEYLVRLANLGHVIFCPRRLVTYRSHGIQDSTQTWLRPSFLDEYKTVHDHSLKVLGESVSDDDRRFVNRRVARVATDVAMVQALAGRVDAARRTLEKATNLHPDIVNDAEYRKSRLLVTSRIVRTLYRQFVTPRSQ